MKVWVPIDLPDGYRVRWIVADMAQKWTASLGPLGPVRPFDEEPAKPIGSAIRGVPYAPEAQRERSDQQRERWEYRTIWIDPDSTMLSCESWSNRLGDDGWELTAVIPGWAWFKRRLP